MIKLDLSMAIFFYLFFTAVLILALWCFYNFGTRMKTFSSDEKYIWHCHICANTYIDSRNEDISKCPRCGSFNQRLEKEDILRGAREDNLNGKEVGK